jgi:hypothetical protein
MVRRMHLHSCKRLHNILNRFPEWEFGPPFACEEEKRGGGGGGEGGQKLANDYDKFSPDTYVGQWKTPTLVIHGGKDYR